LQFMGVLFMRTLHPHGPIRSLWGSDYDSASPPVDLGKRFGVSRCRFEQWRKHIKFAPPYAYITDNAFNCIRPLIHAFNANRLQTIRPGSELILDESMGKWIPVAEDVDDGIPFLTKIARKPQGIGSEYKNIAECTYGIMLQLELQEG
ncbi:hypothetical protein GUITHDRAFT_48120, partial [Guillardia theta CCMP2712]